MVKYFNLEDTFEKGELGKLIFSVANKLIALKESRISDEDIGWASEYEPEKYEYYKVIEEMVDFYKQYGIEFFLRLGKYLLLLNDRKSRLFKGVTLAKTFGELFLENKIPIGDMEIFIRILDILLENSNQNYLQIPIDFIQSHKSLISAIIWIEKFFKKQKVNLAINFSQIKLVFDIYFLPDEKYNAGLKEMIMEQDATFEFFLIKLEKFIQSLNEQEKNEWKKFLNKNRHFKNLLESYCAIKKDGTLIRFYHVNI